jgi:DNA-damage-inducible protein J
MNTTIQTRIDPKLKKDAQKAFKSMGIDLSTGVKLFLTQVVRTQSIPFELFTANNYSESKKRALIKDAEHAMKYGKRYNSAKEMHDDILKNG